MGSVRVALALAAALVALVAVHAAPAAFPAAHERLIYTAESDFGTATFAVDPNGGTARMLVSPTNIGVNGVVSVSPDGTKLAYTDTVAPDLGRIPPKFRGKIHPLHYPVLSYSDMEFQPQSGGVSVIQYGASEVGGVYSRPAWSPDGKHLAVSQGTPGQLQLYEIDTANSGESLVTVGLTGDSIDARWSPDGSWIAFTQRNGRSSQLYLVHSDGSGLHKLSDGTANDKQPDFSPDGQHVVFSSDRSGAWQLYVVPTSGGVPTRLVADPGDDTDPAWSPDGRWIAYSNENGELHSVDMIDAGGGGQQALSTSTSAEVVQDWQPLPHTGNPSVQALASSGLRGNPIRLRYRASDDVPVHVSFSYSVTVDRETSETDSEEFTLPAYRSQAVRLFHADLSDFDLERLLRKAKALGFCVIARDAWGNESTSCSTYRFVR